MHSLTRSWGKLLAPSIMSLDFMDPSGTHSRSVPKSSIEGFRVWEKQVSDICQTLDFELFWLLLNHFSIKTNKQMVSIRGLGFALKWREDHG